MRKLNTKGFTLIELLAVITIMGILMLVAIPAVSRTIENSRKDTFLDTVNQYVNGASTMWAADNLTCKTSDGNVVSSAVPNGVYYINVSTVSSDGAPQLLEQGGKSSWGSRDIKGYIIVKVSEVGSGATATRKVSYHPVLSDNIHGANVSAAGALEHNTAKEGKDLVRGDITMTGAKYPTLKAATAEGVCVEN